MGARGPRGDLPELQAIKGNPGNRKPRTTKVQATGAPFVADVLPDEAKACVAVVIESMPPSAYKKVDGFMLAGFAKQWALFCQLELELQAEALATGVTNAKKIKAQQEALRLMATLGDRLGLNPHARANLNLPAAEKPASKFGSTLNVGAKKPN